MDEELPGARASRWGRLIHGQGGTSGQQTLGKKQVLIYDADAETPLAGGPPFFDFGGADHDAEQMQIVIDSPRVIARSFASLAGQQIQNLSGEYDNATIDSADFPGTTDPIIWPPISALIEWGTNYRTSVIVDIVNGAKVNVSASAVRAWAIVTADAANAPGTSAAYVLGAFATPGWPGASQAARTVYLGAIDHGASSDVFPVPAFAKRATVISCGDGSEVTAATLQFWQAQDGSRNVGNYFVSGNQPGPFVVPNAAAYFSVLSGLAADGVLFSVVFDLAL